MNLVKLFRRSVNKKDYQTIDSLKNLLAKRVILRLDLNVPIRGNDIVDTYRIDSSFATIDFLVERGAVVIILSHLGRSGASLKVVEEYLSKKYKTFFIKDPFTSEFVSKSKNANPGTVFVLENIRNWPEEEANDESFAKKLEEFGDIYVNDAFSVSHRKHASVFALPKLMDSYAGFQFDKEIVNLSKLFKPQKPFILFLGGAKVETKLPLLKSFIDIADKIFVGGVIANDFYKALGYNIGASTTSSEEVSREIVNHPKIFLPADVVVERSGHKINCLATEVLEGDCIVDVGRQTLESYNKDINSAGAILWNGPFGYIEEGFNEGSKEIAQMIASSKAFSAFGGGDSISTVPALIQKKFTFISTGGGAMLDFLANKTLPGLEALKG